MSGAVEVLIFNSSRHSVAAFGSTAPSQRAKFARLVAAAIALTISSCGLFNSVSRAVHETPARRIHSLALARRPFEKLRDEAARETVELRRWLAVIALCFVGAWIVAASAMNSLIEFDSPTTNEHAPAWHLIVGLVREFPSIAFISALPALCMVVPAYWLTRKLVLWRAWFASVFTCVVLSAALAGEIGIGVIPAGMFVGGFVLAVIGALRLRWFTHGGWAWIGDPGASGSASP